MDITIDYDTLINAGISLSEYVYLKSLYDNENDRKIFKVIDRIEEDSLQARGFIKITETEIVLRSKAIDLFEGGNLFLKFLTTFPIKTPSGRYLSPLRNSGIAVDKLEQKWNRVFKGKPHLQNTAIKVLEAELKWRKETGQMEYINQIDVWLNQANYEKYYYLLKEDTDHTQDLM